MVKFSRPPDDRPDTDWPPLTDLAVRLGESGIVFSRKESFILAELIGWAIKWDRIYALEPRVNSELKKKVTTLTKAIERISRVLDDIHRLPSIEGTRHFREIYYGIRAGLDELPGAYGNSWSIGSSQSFSDAEDIAKLIYIRKVTDRLGGVFNQEKWFGELSLNLDRFAALVAIVTNTDESSELSPEQTTSLPFQMPLLEPDKGGPRSVYATFVAQLVLLYCYSGREPLLNKIGQDGEFKKSEFFTYLTIVNEAMPVELWREPATLGQEASKVLRQLERQAAPPAENSTMAD